LVPSIVGCRKKTLRRRRRRHVNSSPVKEKTVGKRTTVTASLIRKDTYKKPAHGEVALKLVSCGLLWGLVCKNRGNVPIAKDRIWGEVKLVPVLKTWGILFVQVLGAGKRRRHWDNNTNDFWRIYSSWVKARQIMAQTRRIGRKEKSLTRTRNVNKSLPGTNLTHKFNLGLEGKGVKIAPSVTEGLKESSSR